MNRAMGTLFVLAGVAAGFAQTINLTGTVTSNQSGKAINGAIVTLVSQKIIDTTDSKGAYLFKNGTAAFAPKAILPASEQITMANGVVSLSLPKVSPIRVELFDMKGNLLERFLNNNAAPGDYQFNLTQKAYSAAMLLVRVSLGNQSSVYRYVPLQNGTSASSMVTKQATRTQGFTKAQAAVDSIRVTATGFMSKSIAITSYSGTNDFKLDTLTMDKFSFFVTSLKALQELSGSTNGFGGDFRFGKTGAGAGLKGADSICECIAERSMKGSKVKQWRAFLSVSSDENGKKVNAIDRIGKGPWYDKKGRLLAPTIADLLSTRPMNGSAEIKNDLPNEDGIPNHRPDPSAAQVDNHHMVTGSNTDGTLKSGATCADWTSKLGTDVASAGFAWPRGGAGGGGGGGGSGQNWMSTWTTPGCEPGIWITEAMSGYGKIIGGGGGYGGFYCFALNP